MSAIDVSESAVIPASPEKVYAALADYQEGHPAILPRQYFKELKVLAGGQGAGSVIEVQMQVFGAKRVLRMEVSEPEPGRVLVEADSEAGVTTTFTVDPHGDGTQSRVTIHTQAGTSPGLKGLLERWLNPPIIRRIFRQELAQLATYVQEASGA